MAVAHALAPIPSWYSPASQLSQTERPVDGALVPLGQSSHDVTPAPLYLPAAQSTTLEVLNQYLPAGATSHALDPSVSAYRRIEQAVHSVAPAEEYVPTPQFEHVTVAASLEYVPAAQSVQLLAPVPEYSPASQSVQTVAPEGEYVPALQSDTVLAPDPTA